MSTTTTITVSIGRNIADRPIGQGQWDRFVERTRAVVLHACASFNDIHFTGIGAGWYQGQAEESFTVVASVDADLLDELAARLALIAKVFGQDSIALTAGTTRIVEAVR